MVCQSTEELSIHTNGTNPKASLTTGDHLPMVQLVKVFCEYWACLHILKSNIFSQDYLLVYLVLEVLYAYPPLVKFLGLFFFFWL